jgi:hypothetical protein
MYHYKNQCLALYRAKNAGCGTWHFYTVDLLAEKFEELILSGHWSRIYMCPWIAVDPATHEVYLPLKPAGKPPVLLSCAHPFERTEKFILLHSLKLSYSVISPSSPLFFADYFFLAKSISYLHQSLFSSGKSGLT